MLSLTGCLSQLLSLIKSIHDEKMSTLQFDHYISEQFGVKSGVKKSCVLALTLLGIFSSTSSTLKKIVCTSTTHQVVVISIFPLSVQAKFEKVNIRDLPFADDALLHFISKKGYRDVMVCIHQDPSSVSKGDIQLYNEVKFTG